MTLIDLTGRTYGRLSVLSREGTAKTPSGQGRPTWRCRCECGAVTVVAGQSLRRGETVSCGCYNREKASTQYVDHSGSRFGRLIALKRGPLKDDGHTTWICDCDCGETGVTVRTQLLVLGAAMSCGCLNRILSANREWRGGAVSYIGMHKRIAAMRGSARTHSCVDCSAPARDWSYNGGDPGELRELVNGSDLAYSTDPDMYSPRCPKCHGKYDSAQRRAS